MMQVVPRWQVDVASADGRVQTIWISEAHLSNVLRTVASLAFSANGLDQPVSLTVQRVTEANQTTTGVLTASPVHGASCAEVRCFLGHAMHYNIETDRFYCQCGAVASKHGAIIVDPDPVEVKQA